MSSEALKLVLIHGSVIRIENTVRDFDETLIDPDSHVIKLLKPDDTQQGTNYTAPTKVSTGIFYQDMDIPSDGVAGEWSVEWAVVKSSHTSIERIRFKVVT